MPVARQGYQLGLSGRLDTWTETHFDSEAPRTSFSILDNLFLRSVVATEWIIERLESESDRADSSTRAQAPTDLRIGIDAKLLATRSGTDAEFEDLSAYITFPQAREMTGLRSYEITRLCDNQTVRSKGNGKKRVVHAGDVGRHVATNK